MESHMRLHMSQIADLMCQIASKNIPNKITYHFFHLLVRELLLSYAVYYHFETTVFVAHIEKPA